MEIFDEISEYLKTHKEPEQEGVLEEEEYQTVILAFLKTRGEEGADEEEVVKIVRWAEESVLGRILLDFVLKGLVSVNLDENGEVVFGKLVDIDV